MVWAAIVVIVLGVLIIWVDRDDQRRARLVAGTATTRIADAEPGVRVEIKGRALAEDGAFIAVPGGGEALYYEVGVLEEYVDEKEKKWRALLLTKGGVPFLVEDGSGRRARVVPAGAEMRLDGKRIERHALAASDLAAELRELVEKKGIRKMSASGKDRVQVQKAVIVPGSPIYALGFGALEARELPGELYRGGSVPVLVMRAGEGDRELLVSNKAEEELLRSLRVGRWVSFVMIVGGLGWLGWCLLR